MLYDPKWKNPEHLTPAQMLLLQAADVLEQRGLAKHTQQDDLGRVCLHGAISVASEGQPYGWSNVLRDAEVLAATYLESIGVGEPQIMFGHDCSGWNNQPERTKEEVVTALRNAAVIQRTALASAE